ncbi:MAG TPA: response regulator [Thermomicrobiales bacterium]|nr:response regulator [Thermomicrobiales bacterium]
MAEGQRKKVLVVNDTQEILTLFNDILESEGHEVHLYSFAFDDLSVVKEVRPDLVVIDLIIGNEDHGWQLLQKMKMDRETATIPVIVCSAAIRLLRELEGRLKEKNVGIVAKPFDIDDLLRAVDAALSQNGSNLRLDILRQSDR